MFKRERNRFLLNNLSGPLSKNIIYYFFGCTTWYVELSQQGIEPMPPAVEVQNLSHWTTLTLSFSFFFPNPHGGGSAREHTGCCSEFIAFVLHTLCKKASSKEAELWLYQPVFSQHDTTVPTAAITCYMFAHISKQRY